MVYQPSKHRALERSRRSTLAYHRRRLPLYIFAFLVSAMAGFILGRFLFHHNSGENTTNEAQVSTQPVAPPSSPEPIKHTPDFINLQPIVDQWLSTIKGTAGVVIYDLDNQKLSASYNSNQFFGTASLYKLFVAYEGYREAEQGLTDLNETRYAGNYTRGECLDLMIRESYSPCAEAMWEEIGRQNLNSIISRDFKLSNSTAMTSTPTDIADMLKIYYHHPDLSAKTWEVIKDSMLNQPATEYDWRQGLPSGFSNTVKVYNKVGFDYSGVDNIWNLYHDAAIVEFPELDRHYIIVVMTSHVSYREIAKLGTAIETAVVEASQQA